MDELNPVFVLGMPRSGATGVANALSRLGVFFGSQDELVQPAPDDAGGRFELRELSQFNRRCLAAFQMHVTSVAPMPAAWRAHPQAPALRHELRKTLAKRIGSQNRWGIKQPMASLLLPIYQEVFQDLALSPHYVLCVRDPLDFPELPLKWNREAGSRWIPPLGTRALGVWLRHTLGALEGAQGARVDVIPFAEFAKEPKPLLERIVSRYPGWSPLVDQRSEATAEVRSVAGDDLVTEPKADACPKLVRDTFSACCELSRGEAPEERVGSLIRSFDLWREMLNPPGNPGTQLGFAWFERGVVKVAQAPFLPAGDWQRLDLSVPAPPGTRVSGLLYGRPCRIWIRHCSWSSPWGRVPAKLEAGPGSRCSEVGGLQLLEGAYESGQVSVTTPTFTGPYLFEIEFFLEAGPQINVDAANRLSNRLQECVARYEALSMSGRSRAAALRGKDAANFS
jgi:hypothetical protein